MASSAMGGTARTPLVQQERVPYPGTWAPLCCAHSFPSELRIVGFAESDTVQECNEKLNN